MLLEQVNVVLEHGSEDQSSLLSLVYFDLKSNIHNVIESFSIGYISTNVDLKAGI